MEAVFDYDNALYCTLWGHWDDLLSIMAKTKDDLLSKKIEGFLTQLHFAVNEQEILSARDRLLYYIDHAMQQTPLPNFQL